MNMERLVAVTLLEYINRALNPFAVVNALVGRLGEDGLTEALRRGWVYADHEAGMIALTNRHDRIIEIKEAAEYQVGDSVLFTDNGKVYSARVKRSNADGTIDLDYEGDKPSVQRPVKKDQVKPIARPEKTQSGVNDRALRQDPVTKKLTVASA